MGDLFACLAKAQSGERSSYTSSAVGAGRGDRARPLHDKEARSSWASLHSPAASLCMPCTWNGSFAARFLGACNLNSRSHSLHERFHALPLSGVQG